MRAVIPRDELLLQVVAAASWARHRGASLREVAQRLWPRLRWAPLREGEPAAIDGPALELQQRLDALVRAGVIQAGPLAPDEVDDIAARTYRA